jgi:hypothetical protein
MKPILIIFSLLMLAAFAAVEMQLQYMHKEFDYISNENDMLTWALISSDRRIDQDMQKISESEAKVNVPTAGQTPK